MEEFQLKEMTPCVDPLHFDELPFWSAPFGLALLDTVQVRSGMKVLDIGSGGGFPMLELADRLDAGSFVTGIDPDEGCNGLAREKIRSRGIINANVIQGYAEKMPFKDECFDLIISNNGLNNVQDLHASLKESFRVLKPNGQMVFTMNLPGTFAEFYEVLEGLLDDLALGAVKDLTKQHIHEKRKPVDYLRAHVLATGFAIRSVQPDGFTYRYADGTAFFNHFLIRNYFMPSWRQILAGAEVLHVFREIETRLNGIAKASGSLQMSVPFVTFDLNKSETRNPNPL